MLAKNLVKLEEHRGGFYRDKLSCPIPRNTTTKKNHKTIMLPWQLWFQSNTGHNKSKSSFSNAAVEAVCQICFVNGDVANSQTLWGTATN